MQSHSFQNQANSKFWSMPIHSVFECVSAQRNMFVFVRVDVLCGYFTSHYMKLDVGKNMYSVDRVTCFVISKIWRWLILFNELNVSIAIRIRIASSSNIFVVFRFWCVWNLIWSNFIDFLKKWTNEWFAHWNGAEVNFSFHLF